MISNYLFVNLLRKWIYKMFTFSGVVIGVPECWFNCIVSDNSREWIKELYINYEFWGKNRKSPLKYSVGTSFLNNTKQTPCADEDFALKWKSWSLRVFKNHFQWQPEVMPTHNTTLSHYRIDRSIIPESFNKLFSVVSEIIRGQNYFLKNENRRYLRINSEKSHLQKRE
jgi:hypothetical protein